MFGSFCFVQRPNTYFNEIWRLRFTPEIEATNKFEFLDILIRNRNKVAVHTPCKKTTQYSLLKQKTERKYIN